MIKGIIYISSLLFLVASLNSYAQTNEEVYSIVDKMPILKRLKDLRDSMQVIPDTLRFNMPVEDVSNQQIAEFIQEHVIYPENFVFPTTKANIFVSFTVDTLGQVRNVQILKSPDTLINQAVIESIQKLPEFIPGELQNNKVSVRMTAKIVLLEPEIRGQAYDPDAPVFFICEQMPLFKGTSTKEGTETAIMNFVDNKLYHYNLNRPKTQKCRVFVSFVVGSDGYVHKAKILRGCTPEHDKIALEIVNSMPAFTPGKQRGKLVNVGYNLPINF